MEVKGSSRYKRITSEVKVLDLQSLPRGPLTAPPPSRDQDVLSRAVSTHPVFPEVGRESETQWPVGWINRDLVQIKGVC